MTEYKRTENVSDVVNVGIEKFGVDAEVDSKDLSKAELRVFIGE